MTTTAWDALAVGVDGKNRAYYLVLSTKYLNFAVLFEA